MPRTGARVRYITTVLVLLPALGFLLSCGQDHGSPPPCDGQSAFAFLIRQTAFGPRVPGSESHSACLAFLTSELKKYGALVTEQNFVEKLPHLPQPARLTNIIASFGVKKKQRVLLCAHWDSRPWADQDSDETRRQSPVPGANDGASGVAILLEVARQIQAAEPRYGVDIILFDGEDSGQSGVTEFALGARYFAANKAGNYRPAFGILLDMVGDRDLQIYQEHNSLKYAPRVVNRVWKTAAALGLPSFHAEPRYQVTDDHLPLLEAGIPCVDLIDFDYPYWHTTEDTPDKCSPESLAEVGRLLLALIY